jgi:trehalose-phosphatase
MASREAAEQIRAQARQIGVHLNATALEGKEVVELAVVKVSKGEALARLRAEHRAGIVLYAGDDVTDETVFATLGRDDIGIKVGDGASAAKLRASDPADVARFLQMLADQLNAQ